VRNPQHSSGAADLSNRSSGATSLGHGDGKIDLGEPVEGLAVPGKASAMTMTRWDFLSRSRTMTVPRGRGAPLVPSPLTTAACCGLRSAADSRTRRGSLSSLVQLRWPYRRATLVPEDPLRKWSAPRASAINLRTGSVTPLDAGRLPTFN
jgi:hypothetical protein